MNLRNRSRSASHAVSMLLGLLLLPAVMVGMPAGAQAGTTPEPVIVIEHDGHCIAPADEMRRHHPEMLKHQRDLTVRGGVRGARVSLNRCIECHASRSNGSVRGSDRNFCQGCHSYMAVELDCFECHQAAPGRYGATAGAPAELAR